MDNIKLSIIVPVYNVEKYVERCLKSLCGLKISNEIIVVNDGSMDNSLEIVEKFKEEHSSENIKIISQENKGLSGARNTGIREAKGEYISFIDSDDFVDTEKFEELVNKTIENDLDFSVGNYINYFNNNQSLALNYENVEKSIKIGKKIYEELSNKDVYSNVVWMKIYNREFIEKNNLYFVEGILCEDILYSFFSYFYAKKVKVFDIAFYNYYLENNDSITTKKNNKKIFDILYSVDIIFKSIYKESEDYIKSIFKVIFNQLDSIIEGHLFYNGSREGFKILSRIKNIIDENQEIVKQYSVKEYEKYKNISFFMINLKYNLKNIEKEVRKLRDKILKKGKVK